jgi:hypothetical protein
VFRYNEGHWELLLRGKISQQSEWAGGAAEGVKVIGGQFLNRMYCCVWKIEEKWHLSIVLIHNSAFIVSKHNQNPLPSLKDLSVNLPQPIDFDKSFVSIVAGAFCRHVFVLCFKNLQRQ